MIFTKYPNDFWHKREMDNFDPYNVLLSIATNIPVLLMTAFVLQGHIYEQVHNQLVFKTIAYFSPIGGGSFIAFFHSSWNN